MSASLQMCGTVLYISKVDNSTYAPHVYIKLRIDGNACVNIRVMRNTLLCHRGMRDWICENATCFQYEHGKITQIDAGMIILPPPVVALPLIS